jgi:SAM-dependent MidA family methyltransferase
MIFARVGIQGGAVLTIDYGYDTPLGSSTLQAVRGHKKVDVLDCPGESDLTALVDFARLVDIARAAGLDVAGPVGQGAFLKSLGVDARLRNIINSDETANRAELNAGLARLVDPDQMGTLFKVMCAYHTGVGVRPEGF